MVPIDLGGSVCVFCIEFNLMMILCLILMYINLILSGDSFFLCTKAFYKNCFDVQYTTLLVYCESHEGSPVYFLIDRFFLKILVFDFSIQIILKFSQTV